jgi:two-component system, cell cycle sensor histidine kinase and response regulator CckA
MPAPFHILHLEDTVGDRELTAAALAADGLDCAFTYAATRAEFLHALANEDYDVILCDFTLPGYSGLAALEAARMQRPEIPFLFVSGTIGEERAVASLKLGATDCVLKDHPDNLAPAVRRALGERHDRHVRQTAEAHLHQAQKLEAIEQLARGVAHNFNNLLTPVRANAEILLMDSGPEASPGTEMLGDIIKAADRGADLVRRLGAFSRSQSIHPARMSLNEFLARLSRKIKDIVGEHTQVRMLYGAGLTWLQGDDRLLEEAILSLVSNARDAMPHGGQLQITTEPVRISPADAQAHPEAGAGEFICLIVRDTGTGIQPENVPHLFEPFYSTKEVGQGTGLGLATVFGIVQQHHGWIEVVTRPKVGTAFKIFLPAGRPKAPDTES